MRSFIARINAPEGRRRRAMSASGYFRHGRDRGEKDAILALSASAYPCAGKSTAGEVSKRLSEAFALLRVRFRARYHENRL